MNTISGIGNIGLRVLVRVALFSLLSQFAWQQAGFALQLDVGAAGTATAPTYDYKLFDAPVLDVRRSFINPLSINANGQVTGRYLEDCDVVRCSSLHGFLYKDGVVTTLDVPGATGTSPESINDSGQVTGYYDDASGRHGFVYRAGTFTTVDFPGARQTWPKSINDRGQVTGSVGFQGFVYTDGALTMLVVPGASSTGPESINDRGEVTGGYGDASGPHGFIYSNGTFTTIDVPGAQSTRSKSINNHGQVTGSFDEGFSRIHGFLFSAGTLTTLDVPSARFTDPSSINDSGQATGFYGDASRNHGFVYRSGTFTTLDAPGAINTVASGINNSGQVTGNSGQCEFDGSFSCESHGFIATPVVAVLDDFNREDGRLGPDWKGKAGVSAYRIVDQQISVGTGGPVYWQPNPFGLNQEAFVKLTRIDPAGAEQGLLLKVQSDTGNYRKGAIAVKYDAARQVIRVTTWRPRKASWRNYRDLPVAFADGDKLGARALADGKVRIFRNDQQVGRITLGPVDRQFFNERTGRVGLWFENAPNAIVDDFGGGTRMH